MFRLPALLSLAILSTAMPATAGVVLPTLQFPDIAAANLQGDLGSDLAFQKSNEMLALKGMLTQFTPRALSSGEMPVFILNGELEFSGVLGASTGEADTRELSGSIELSGQLMDLNGPATFGGLSTGSVVTLLKGTLRGVTSIFNPTASRAEFYLYFDVDQSSHLASFYGPTARTQIVAHTNAANYDNDFFVNLNASNTADTNPTIPEPTALLTWGVLAAGIVARQRRQRRAPALD